jgi:hypothetical protein
MDIWFWHTWLAFVGVIAGIVVAAVTGGALARYALMGFAGGLVLVIAWNAVLREPPPCLSNAKGVDILRAYNFDCTRSKQSFIANLVEGKRDPVRDLLGPQR